VRFARIVPVLLIILLSLPLISGCEMPAATSGGYPVTPTYNYVVPTMTYLRDCPGYDCGIVTEAYSGDQVVVLDQNSYGWKRVQLDRTGAVGWISADLLSYSPGPASFYVSLSTVYMRGCADYNCSPVELLHRGDRVDRLNQESRGWWRVKSLRTGQTGWIPAAALSIRPGPAYYYVNVNGLSLRSGPSTSHRILTTLRLNNQVEVVGSSMGGWLQVRDTRTNIIGWVYGRYVEAFPVKYPRSVPKHQPKSKSQPSSPKAM
jgi:uncharacterized protein YgiM (DUF1202 family)